MNWSLCISLFFNMLKTYIQRQIWSDVVLKKCELNLFVHQTTHHQVLAASCKKRIIPPLKRCAKYHDYHTNPKLHIPRSNFLIRLVWPKMKIWLKGKNIGLGSSITSQVGCIQSSALTFFPCGRFSLLYNRQYKRLSSKWKWTVDSLKRLAWRWIHRPKISD